MNPYVWPVVCDVCGGDGFGTARAASAEWDARARVVHTNPEVCRSHLDRRRRELEAREQKAVA